MSERAPIDSKIAELNSTETEGNKWINLVYHLCEEFGKFWDDKLEFRVKLFVVLIICLAVNLNLIHCAWKKYGNKITERFMKSGQLEEVVNRLLFVCHS